MPDPSAARTRKGAKIYIIGVGVAQICALFRYTLLTRLLSPEQLGLAVTLILTAQFFDSVSDSGSDRFLVQDKHGDEPRTQSLVQLLSVARGFLIAGALVIFAKPIAWFYNEPTLIVGLMWLGIAPLIGGFLHFDVRRVQRHHDFRREGICMLVADVASVMAMIGAAALTQSYVAAIAGLTVRSLALVVISHFTAERAYKIRYDAAIAPVLGAFALPLMANGLVLFLSSQGDRLLVGNQLGVVELGRYSAMLLLIYFPSMAIMKYFHTMQMPIIAAARGDQKSLDISIDRMAGDALLLSIVMATGFAVVAPFAAPFLFGQRFAQPLSIIALIGTLQVCRFIRIWPTTSALALGKSQVVLFGNLLRLISYITAIAGAIVVGGLLGLTLGFVIGELACVATTVMMTNVALKVPFTRDIDRIAMLALSCAAITAAAEVVENRGFGMAMTASGAAAAVIFGAVWRERDVVSRWILETRLFVKGIRHPRSR